MVSIKRIQFNIKLNLDFFNKEKIDKLVEMSNSDRTTALSALSQSNWNLETALQCFMS